MLPLGADDKGPIDNYGTNSDGSKSEEYCEYCFLDGKFTEPDITYDQMKDKLINIFVDEVEMPLEIALKMIDIRLPNLNRWNKKN